MSTPSGTTHTSGNLLEETFSSLIPHDGIEIREGYADVGSDVRLHYVEAGEGPLLVLLHGFPEFWSAGGCRSRPSRRRGSVS